MTQFKTTETSMEEFVDIYECLSAIGQRPDLEISYPVARNLKLEQLIYKDYKKDVFEAQKKYATLKDGELQSDSTGKIIIPDFNKPLLNNAIKTIGERLISFQVYEIKKEDYPDATWAKIPANLLTPLLDIIIIEDGSKKLKKA